MNEEHTESRFSRSEIVIRPGLATDLDNIIGLDATNTGIEKSRYWQTTFDRFDGRDGRHFLVAERPGETGALEFLGFIAGEVRAWEFGSPPCGWILTIGVDPNFRVLGVGSLLFDAICQQWRDTGVTTVRTMLAREDRLNMSFFRSQGMRAGSFIELEMGLDE